jgi:GPI-anchor transamidase subunit K
MNGLKDGRFGVLWPMRIAILLCSLLWAVPKSTAAASTQNIHVVLVSSSRYWFNYRHAMNALGFYQVLRENGIPDSQIVLMIADEYAINPRNPFKNGMYANGVKPEETWYSAETELDFRGADVTVRNFFDAILGIGPKSLQNLDEESYLLVLLTGHGGDNFFKFQDEEELTSTDIANLIDELSRRKKFKKMLLIADTCQAFTLFDKVNAPNVYALGTSLRKENAYAHHSDIEIGLSVIERWTHGFLTQYRNRPRHAPSTTLHDLMVAPFAGFAPLGAHVGTIGDFRELRLRDFFGVPPEKGEANVSLSSTKKAVKSIKSSAKVVDRISSEGIARKSKVLVAPDMIDKDSEEFPPLEPGDSYFCLLAGLLIALVVATSQLGKAPDDNEEF